MIQKIILFLLSSLLLGACKKDSAQIYIQAAKDAALGERLVADVLKQILSTAPKFVNNEEDSLINGIHLSSQPELSDSTYPKKITIDFRNGVIGSLGKKRIGKIIVSVNSSKVITENLAVSFDQYSSDGTEIWGNINYNYDAYTNGYNSELLNNGISIINANGTMKWSGTFILNQISSGGTLDVDDDTYGFECTTTGVDFEQTSFNYNTTVNHVIKFKCPQYIISGTSVLKPNNKSTQTINFGSGNCDDNAIIQLSDGSQKNFTF